MKKLYTNLTPKEVAKVKESALAMNLHAKNKGLSKVIVWGNPSSTVMAHRNFLKRNFGILPRNTSLRRKFCKRVSHFFKRWRP